MDTESQKKLCCEFLLALDRGDAEFADNILAGDFTFENMETEPVTNPVTGEQFGPKLTRAEFMEHGVPANRRFTEDGMHYQFEIVIGEGSYVAIFGSSDATGLNGRKYANRYCWLFGFAGDQIEMMREYRDTYLSRKTLFE
jgi:ketosteroid isomerase-like protein